jgi:tryptophan synthase beta chain
VIEQEMSTEREIEIPEPVRDVYRQWRPSPLFRARRLEQALDTPARIYYKYEGVSPAGSHKPNTAIPQAFYNKDRGRQAHHHRDRRRPVGLVAGAGGLHVRAGDRRLHGPGQLRRQALPRAYMETFGAECIASPSDRTESGRAILADTRTAPAAWASPSARRWRWPCSATTPATPSARC